MRTLGAWDMAGKKVCFAGMGQRRRSEVLQEIGDGLCHHFGLVAMG